MKGGGKVGGGDNIGGVLANINKNSENKKLYEGSLIGKWLGW
jgi:hypothetical protein